MKLWDFFWFRFIDIAAPLIFCILIVIKHKISEYFLVGILRGGLCGFEPGIWLQYTRCFHFIIHKKYHSIVSCCKHITLHLLYTVSDTDWEGRTVDVYRDESVVAFVVPTYESVWLVCRYLCVDTFNKKELIWELLWQHEPPEMNASKIYKGSTEDVILKLGCTCFYILY